MENKNYFPKITASSVEQFNALSDLVKRFPQKFIDQIELVENHIYNIFHLKEPTNDKNIVYIPDFARHITPTLDVETNTIEYSIYAGNSLLMKITKPTWHKSIELNLYAFDLIKCPDVELNKV